MSETKTVEPHSSRKAFVAAAWLLFGYGGAQILRLASSLILTRILFAEAFGTMALVTSFLIGLHLFSDVGIGPSIVQSEHGDDPDFLDTAFTIQAIRGVGLFGVGVVLSFPFAYVYSDKPDLLPMLLATNLVSLFTGVQSTRIFTASRHLAQRRLSLLEISCQTISITTTILFAYVFREVWTLVVGGLVYDLLRTIGSHIVLPGHRDRLRIDLTHARSMMTFGRWIFLSTALTFFVSHADKLIFGKLLEDSLFGIYSIAVTLTMTVPTALTALAQGTLFPVYARVVQSGGSLSGIFARARRPMLILSAMVTTCFLAGGPALVELLYDPRYRDAGPIVRVLAIGAFFTVLELATGRALLALGQSRFMAAGGLAKLVTMIILLPVGIHFGGVLGACLGYAASDLVRYLVTATAGRAYGLHTVSADVLTILQLGVTALVAIYVDAFAAQRLHAPPLLRVLTIGGIVLTAHAPQLRSLLSELKALRSGDVAASAVQTPQLA